MEQSIKRNTLKRTLAFVFLYADADTFVWLFLLIHVLKGSY